MAQKQLHHPNRVRLDMADSTLHLEVHGDHLYQGYFGVRLTRADAAAADWSFAYPTQWDLSCGENAEVF